MCPVWQKIYSIQHVKFQTIFTADIYMFEEEWISPEYSTEKIQDNSNLIKQLFACCVVLNGKLELRIHRQHAHV